MRTLCAQLGECALEFIGGLSVDDLNLHVQFPNSVLGLADGVVLLANATVIEHSRRIAELAQSVRLPTAFQQRENVDAGGLFSYGVDINNQFRQAAFYVDRILKGEKPAELPVQRPTKFELVINLKTAKTLGLTVPLIMGPTVVSAPIKVSKTDIPLRRQIISAAMIEGSARKCRAERAELPPALRTGAPVVPCGGCTAVAERLGPFSFA
jgi:hypothetical protein